MALVESVWLDVDAILARFPGPVRLTATKRVAKAVLIVGLVIEFLLGQSLVTGDGVTGAVLTAIIVVMFPILTSAILLLWPDGLALTLDGAGFTVEHLLLPRACAWSEVGDFAAWKSRAFELTIYNDRSHAAGIIDRLRSGLRRVRFGRDAALPDTYYLEAESLAQLMALWQQRALSEHS